MFVILVFALLLWCAYRVTKSFGISFKPKRSHKHKSFQAYHNYSKKQIQLEKLSEEEHQAQIKLQKELQEKQAQEQRAKDKTHLLSLIREIHEEKQASQKQEEEAAKLLILKEEEQAKKEQEFNDKIKALVITQLAEAQKK